MSLIQTVSIPTLPNPLQWRGKPQNWSLDPENKLSISAGRQTDWFIDPGGTMTIQNAPALLAPIQRPCILKALVTSDCKATFDAGVLVVYQADDQWAKLCLELSPQKQLTIVSVVTKGTSDDCNSVPVTKSSIYLRVSILEKAYAFHYSLDGSLWNLVRYFTLDGNNPVEVGFLAQSPTGEGCTATFSEIVYLPEKLADIRSGQ